MHSAYELIAQHLPEHINEISRIQTAAAGSSVADKIKAYEDQIAQYQSAYVILLRPLTVTIVTDVKGLRIYDPKTCLYSEDKNLVIDPFVRYNYIARANGFMDLAFSIGPLLPDADNEGYEKELKLERYILGRDSKAQSYKVLEGGLVHNFYLNGDETIVDPKMKLMWIKAPHLMPNNGIGIFNKREADKYVSKLNYAGYSDWRLPFANEFVSISNSLEFFDLHVSSGWSDVDDNYWSNTKNFGGYTTLRVSKRKLSNVFSAQPVSLWPCRSFKHLF